jgi:hypothetical protein
LANRLHRRSSCRACRGGHRSPSLGPAYRSTTTLPRCLAQPGATQAAAQCAEPGPAAHAAGAPTPPPAVPPWWPYRRRSSEHCLTPPSPAASRLTERCCRRATRTTAAMRRGHPTPVHCWGPQRTGVILGDCPPACDMISYGHRSGGRPRRSLTLATPSRWVWAPKGLRARDRREGRELGRQPGSCRHRPLYAEGGLLAWAGGWRGGHGNKERPQRPCRRRHGSF